LRQPPHQLFDEGATRPLAAASSLDDDRVVERQFLAIEAHQLAAAILVRERHFDGLVDAAGATGQGGFQVLRPVGGENEKDVGILLQSIHLVEQPVEHGFLARPHVAAVACDQVDVLDHNHRWLQQPCQAHIGAEQADLLGGDNQGRVSRQVRREIAYRMGLARAGRSVKQDALARRLSEPP